MANSKPSRESYTQKIVFLLLPIVGIVALKGITTLRHPAELSTANAANSERVTGNDSASQKSALTEMKKHLMEATDAAEGGDFTKAKGEYSEFKDIWNTVERNFKEKAGDSHRKIEDGISEVNSSLLNTTPNKEKVASSLKSLTQIFDAYSSSVLK